MTKSSPKLFSPITKTLSNLFYIGIAPGRGTNRNEALNRWINSLFSGSKVGIRLAYALLMIVFDRINHRDKRDSSFSLPEKPVEDNRHRIVAGIIMQCSSNKEMAKKVFGIGVIAVSANNPGSKETNCQESKNENTCPLNHTNAVDVLTAAQIRMLPKFN